MRRDISAIQAELRSTESQAGQERQRLEELIEKATKLLTRNNADVGAQTERLQETVASTAGQIETLTEQLKQLTKQFDAYRAATDVKLTNLTTINQPKPINVPKDRDALFAEANRALSDGKHEAGRKLLRHFLARYPGDPRLAKAQLALGESYFAQQKFAPAIQEYRKIIEIYRKSAVLPDALYKVGMAFYQLRYCSDAKVFLSELTRKYRKYPQIKSAKKTLRLIRRYRKNSRICTS